MANVAPFQEKNMEKSGIVQGWLTYNTEWMNSNAGKRCSQFEKNWLDCASQLGLNRANVECSVEASDLKECQSMDLAYKRYNRMQEERQKKGMPYLDPPPIDALPYHKFKNTVF